MSEIIWHIYRITIAMHASRPMCLKHGALGNIGKIIWYAKCRPLTHDGLTGTLTTLQLALVMYFVVRYEKCHKLIACVVALWRRERMREVARTPPP